ncbi:hypothetical protein EDC02_3802 [Micromonospora sp. Llam0]|uniref:hypothetical protein n=1 Tax=Micromonospora sp. Llam0 TaxID=2485143 RepID=UPI000F491275|nr:hypothetical protein [Micromonospora sp. Llam0]ROO61845.1 hypothetical protein EDC02_3802 [Micromonospora sp. Llam0]
MTLVGRAPCVDGLYRADGTSRLLAVDGPQLSWFEFGLPFNLGGRDDFDVLEVDSAARAELPDGGSVCCGEGVLGSDGFFARTDAEGEPIWIAVLTNSNPFVRVDVAGSAVRFTNNLGNSLTIDLGDPNLAAA